MILELNHTEFYKCRNLLAEPGQIEAKAIIEGMNPGRIWVDNIDNPTTGFIWLGNHDGFIFIGNEENNRFNTEINYLIDKVIIPEAKKVGLTWFEAIGNHQKWDQTLKKIFEHRKLGNWNQRVYMLQKRNGNVFKEPAVSRDYQIVKMRDVLLEDRKQLIKNTTFLQSKIKEFWPSYEEFLMNGIGYCVLYKNEIVSICFTGFVVGNVHCVDIETLKEHRGKNLAKKVAFAFIKECLESNLVAYWDCMESNKPSIAVAENLGFELVFNYTGYEFQM